MIGISGNQDFSHVLLQEIIKRTELNRTGMKRICAIKEMHSMPSKALPCILFFVKLRRLTPFGFVPMSASFIPIQRNVTFMRNVLFVLALFLSVAIVSCQEAKAQNGDLKNSTSPKLSPEEIEERNKKIALANAEAIQAHDIDAASKHFAPDIINYGNGSIPPQRGIEAVTASLRMFTSALPIDKVDNLVAVADGDWVMLWGKWSGTWKGDIMGQKATGKSFTKPDVEIFRFNDEGKIIEHHSVQSIGEVARQIGMKLPGQ